MVFEIRKKKKKKKYRRNGKKKENVRRSASRTPTTVIRRFPEPARQPLGPSKTQRLVLKKKKLVSNERVSSHAGVFRGARLWGGMKNELP